MKNILRKITTCIAVSFALVSCSPAFAESVKLTWKAPTTRENGAPLSLAEIGSYVVFLNNNQIATPAPASTSMIYPIAVGACVKSTDIFFMIVIDTKGNKSKLSNSALLAADVCTPIPAVANPGAPTNVTAAPS